ncbi:MAG: hypothetical protein LBS37_00065, partial [Treponema sp.]|nr:hypothetical protein [Treponema sp.]
MKKYANSIIGAILSAGIIVFLASCLNPIGFDPSNIQLKIDAKVSGEVDVRSSDYAILWVINRTSSVDVTGMTISRAGAETKEVTGKPARASTHASYHEPTDIPYRVDITYALSPGNTNSAYDAGNSTGSFTIAEKYMPKAGANYVIYVYRADDGKVIVVEDERITRPLDPSDTENPIEPPAEGTPTYPLIIRNVTADLDVEYITFRLDDKILTIDPGPKAKDEVLWYFEAGQYKVQVPLPLQKTTVEKNVPIIKPNDSQSWHTLYMWIYKTTNNFYSTTTTWPPNPNDAADVSMSDIAGPGMGILQVINKSESSDVIQKIRIGERVYLFGTIDSPSFTKDMEWMRVLDPGIHTVEIMPSRQNYYGMALSVNIKEGEVTTLSYYDRLADPDLPPPEIGGYGSGLVKIINNSTGVVNSVVIRDTSANNSMSYSYGEFTPPDPINYNKTGRIGVVGDADFPITEGAHYLIQVELNLPDDYVVIERLAALKDQVVEIVINESEIQNVHGANITLVNSTSAKPVQITTVTLYNVSNPGEASSFSGLNWNPQGNVPSGGTAGFRVNSSISMPIKTGSSFSASIGITN